jgi:hypothetical protein
MFNSTSISKMLILNNAGLLATRPTLKPDDTPCRVSASAHSYSSLLEAVYSIRGLRKHHVDVAGRHLMWYFTERRGRVVRTLLYIRDAVGSNFAPEAGYSEKDFSWFSSVSLGTCKNITLHYTTNSSFCILLYLSINNSKLYSLYYW